MYLLKGYGEALNIKKYDNGVEARQGLKEYLAFYNSVTQILHWTNF